MALSMCVIRDEEYYHHKSVCIVTIMEIGKTYLNVVNVTSRFYVWRSSLNTDGLQVCLNAQCSLHRVSICVPLCI